jgi:hypothetical protein
MAAYGEDSSRSALTFMPPVTRHKVSLKKRINRLIRAAGQLAAQTGKLSRFIR